MCLIIDIRTKGFFLLLGFLKGRVESLQEIERKRKRKGPNADCFFLCPVSSSLQMQILPQAAEDMADIDTTTLEHLFALNPSQLEQWLHDHQIPVPGVSLDPSPFFAT